MMKGRIMTNRSLFMVIVVAGCIFAHGSALAVEHCVDNPESGANRPDICVDWDQGDQPTEGVDFDVFFADLANPDVTLATGAAWNVRSKDNAGNPANIGDIKIDATVVTDSFDLAITDNSGGFGVGGPGAANVGSIILSDPTNWTGHSSITAGQITGDLAGDLTVVKDTSDNGGELNMTIDGTVAAAATITVVDLSFLYVGGDVNGVLNITDMLPGSQLLVGGAIGANGAMTITGSAEIFEITGDVDGDVSIGTIVESGKFRIGVVTEPPERVVLVKSDLKGTVSIDVNLGSIHVSGDLLGALTVSEFGGPFAWMSIFGVTGVDAVVTIGNVTTVGHSGIVFGNAAGIQFDGRLILQNGIAQSNFTISFHGPVNAVAGHDAIDFNGKDLNGTIELTEGGSGNIVNIKTLQGHLLVNSSPLFTYGGTISAESMPGTVSTVANGDFAGTLDVTGDFSGFIRIGNGNDLSSLLPGSAILIGGDATGDIIVGRAADGLIDVEGDIIGNVTIDGTAAGDFLVEGRIDGTLDIGGEFSGNICAANVPPGGPLPSNITVGSIDDDPATGATLCGSSIGCLANMDCTENPEDPDTANLCDLNRCWFPCNAVGVVCDPVAAARPYHVTANNRYLTFDPNNYANGVALEVELTAGPGTLGVLGWVGPPDPSTGVSRIVADAHYEPFWPGVIQLADCGIVTGATYEIRADNGTSVSLPLTISTVPVTIPPIYAT